jgi:hypothetical protein
MTRCACGIRLSIPRFAPEDHVMFVVAARQRTTKRLAIICPQA